MNKLLWSLLISITATTACSSGKNETASPAETPIPVQLAAPATNDLEDWECSGQVEAAQSATISTRVMGFITMLKVKTGDPVTKGQLLVSISNQDILARRSQTESGIAEATAALANAKKDLDRFTILYQQQSATAKELDNVTLQYRAAASRLQAAEQMKQEVIANLGYTHLTAPFSGIVTQKFSDMGSMANPGSPILTIEQKGSYQVTAAIPENNINQVKLNAPAMVTIKAINKSFTGKVIQINQSAAYTGGQYIIKIAIPEKDKMGLYAGMYANITLAGKTKLNTASVNTDKVLVPVAAIVYRDQLTGLYTIGNNNTALLRWVRLGRTVGTQVEVLSGLEKKEKFVLAAEGKLYNGAPVLIK